MERSAWTANGEREDDMLEEGQRSKEHTLVDQETDDPLAAPQQGFGTSCWMSSLQDDVLLSSLSIPGTHDSAAFTRPWPFIATQNMDIVQQLDSGIRYFDLRCGIVDDIAEMVHGAALLGLKLPQVMDTIYQWLDDHPREAIIVQIKKDREPERSTVHFAQAVFTCISTRSDRWRTANSTPTMGEVRGKIQLFRRYRGPNLWAYGIDVTQWQDNPSIPFTITTRNMVQLTIQDHYSFPDPQSLPSLIAIKGGDVSGLLDRASKDVDSAHWYINFTSAYEFNFYYQLTPRAIATGGYYQFRWVEGINVRLHNWIRTRAGRQHFGIVAMDFPEAGGTDLIVELIKSNFKRHKEPTWLVVLCMAISVIALVLVMCRFTIPFGVQDILEGILAPVRTTSIG
ncbi:hypothetical protein DOTSEDRAFT_40688 [Dothistroma septosporum NZE10]|uniref:Phosphatidylinositol-specific phospholipase C X domain-containing protein n=1 Tax=Dothistroma septosporum (strain NZE10 / CBS 128990) TaxID=675120 RepID=N1Q1D8_DOTSN|nr:hypothetical protein DOTSEDRAFT_40688 [Dothistroma septosporum NZE10]